jgi:hypothetical protein
MMTFAFEIHASNCNDYYCDEMSCCRRLQARRDLVGRVIHTHTRRVSLTLITRAA